MGGNGIEKDIPIHLSYQVLMILVTFSRSLVQRSRSKTECSENALFRRRRVEDSYL